MKTGAMIIVGTLLGTCAWAAAADANTIVVCIEQSTHASEVSDAATVARRLFRSAGVNLEWHASRRFCESQSDRTIRVALSTNTPRTLRPDALAYALPYEGVHIQVFFDRILGADPKLQPSLLAHVIVHEIAHILQGVDRHSASGIMKASWDAGDYIRMKIGQLQFTSLDIEIIHDSLAKRKTENSGFISTATVVR